MTQEDKQLLLKDLAARLPYGVICEFSKDKISVTAKLGLGGLEEFIYGTDVKPYLRPMSSMTEEEKQGYVIVWDSRQPYLPTEAMDWLNEHHFDYRGLIEKGLALEAPDGMYKTE